MAEKKPSKPVVAGAGKLRVPLHEFPGLRTLEGEPVDAALLKDKVVLITNVSSNCGYTKMNYEGLNKLYDEFRGALEIVGVPCNQFGAQEPGQPSEIRAFVRSNFNSQFTLTEKCDVNGPNTHPLYVELKRATGTSDVDVRWNFESKFIVEPTGDVRRFTKAFDPAKLHDEVAAVVGKYAAAAGARAKL